MEYLHNGFTLELSPGTFPLSTDSVALAGFAKLPRNARVLDLGSGCGTLGLFLCAAHSDCTVTGIEIDKAAHYAALKNAEANGISSRLTSICDDFTHIPSKVPAGSFCCCISNPPYFSSGPESKTLPLARRDVLCSMDVLFRSAAWALKYGGDFFLVHRPERLSEICYYANSHHLEPKRLCLLRHRADGPVALVLIQCRKGAKPGLAWEEHSLFDTNGEQTEYYRQLYHL